MNVLPEPTVPIPTTNGKFFIVLMYFRCSGKTFIPAVIADYRGKVKVIANYGNSATIEFRAESQPLAKVRASLSRRASSRIRRSAAIKGRGTSLRKKG